MKNFFIKNKFIIVCLMCFLLVLFGLFSNAFGVKYESLEFKIGKVKASCLNVRCGPGISYNKVGKLYSGDYVDVFAKVGNWYIIQTDNSLVGAVSADYIEAVYNEEERYSEKNSDEEEKTLEKVNIEENQEQTENETIILEEFANSFALTEEEQEFLDLINANRRLKGLNDLQIDEGVQNIARLKAQDLKENNYFSHMSEVYGDIQDMLKSFDISYITSGENIAGNSNLTGAVEAWMNSANHKANILNVNYDVTGIAVVSSDTYGKIFVQIFVQK